MIEFQNVIKNYGSVAAINGVSLNIPESGIYCLLGRNGAGKTTFMKMLAGHIGASSGQILVEGRQVGPGKMPECVNYIESGAALFNMRVSQLIEAAAQLQENFDLGFARQMMHKFNLNPNKRYKKLSFGMKTMVTAIINLSNNAKVILMDEPTLGFDAIMRDQFNTLLLESYQANPRVIIVSTHLIDEIAKVAERLIIIESGKILIEAGLDEIDEKAYILSGAKSLVEPLLSKAGLNCIGKNEMGSVVAAYIYDDRILPPEGVSVDRLGLQDFFVSIVGGRKNV